MMDAARQKIDDAVLKAAQWLADQADPPRVAVPILTEMFDLSALQACQAISMAQRFRIVRRAHG